MNPENAAALKESGVIVLLDASADVIRGRLSGDRSRPLLSGPDREEALRRIYSERTGAYRAAADLVVEADGSVNDTAEKVREAVKIPLNQNE